MDYFPKTNNSFISIASFVLILIGSIFLSHLVGMAKAKVILNDEGIIHIWTRRFLFSDEKNMKIPWEIIDSYVFQEDRTFDSFIINFNNKRRYKVSRLNFFPINDDFKDLVKEFPKKSNEFKEKTLPNNKRINEGETIYSSKFFKWVFYFMLGLFILLLYGKINDPRHTSSWSSLGVLGSVLLFYWVMILIKRKN